MTALFGIHRTKYFADNFVGPNRGAVSVKRAVLAHHIHSIGEKIIAIKNYRILGKKAKDKTCHKPIHIRATFGVRPICIGFQQLHIQTARTRVAFLSKLDSSVISTVLNPAKVRKKSKVFAEIRIVANAYIPIRHVLGLEIIAIGGKDEFYFLCFGGGAFA